MEIDYPSIRMGLVFEDVRRRNHMNQEELAHRSGLNRTTISDIERDVNRPTLDSFIKLAFAYQMKPSELFQEIEKKTNLLDYQNKIEEEY
ncbi:helix-turn-helix transcriptional regulator [Niallia oryzisoli]|uniref:Helix-turn-helix transcriptional regulator n=1 Tax=Niallia oryzisoli TaxID=1737571 RepID=A0ABZ2CDX7_9BACI